MKELHSRTASPEDAEEIDSIKAKTRSMIDGAKKASSLVERSVVTDSDLGFYLDRAKTLGANAANEWLLKKYPD